MKKTNNLKINSTCKFFTYNKMFKMLINGKEDIVRNILNNKFNQFEKDKNPELKEYILGENFNLKSCRMIFHIIEDTKSYEIHLAKFLEEDQKQDNVFSNFHRQIIMCLLKSRGLEAIKCLNINGISFSINDYKKIIDILFSNGLNQEDVLKLADDNPILYNIAKEYAPNIKHIKQQYLNCEISNIKYKLSKIVDYTSNYSFTDFANVYEDVLENLDNIDISYQNIANKNYCNAVCKNTLNDLNNIDIGQENPHDKNCRDAVYEDVLKDLDNIDIGYEDNYDDQTMALGLTEGSSRCEILYKISDWVISWF